MIIVSQNKENVYVIGGPCTLGYRQVMFAEEFRVRDTIVILSNGDVEVIGVYESKERCLQILKDICEAYREECYTKEFFDVAVQAIRSAIYQKNAVFELPEK